MIDAPWFSDEELAARQPQVPDHVEAWARAFCAAYDVKPDQLIGLPQLPRWRSYVYLAEVALKAKAIIDARDGGAPNTAPPKAA